MYFVRKSEVRRREIHSHDVYRLRLANRKRRVAKYSPTRTRGIDPFLSLHCKLNFSCIIVTEIISCRNVERVVERKRIHVLQEQIIAIFVYRFPFRIKFLCLYLKEVWRESIEIRDYIVKEVVLAWTLLLNIPFHILHFFTIFTRTLISCPKSNE